MPPSGIAASGMSPDPQSSAYEVTPDLVDVDLARVEAEIAHFVGQREVSITADTYTHVLSDGHELQSEELLLRGRAVLDDPGTRDARIVASRGVPFDANLPTDGGPP